jgi:toxin CptA
MTSAPAIAFEYRPSRLLRRALIGVATLAVASLLLGAWPWWCKLPAAAGVVLSLCIALRRWARTPVAAVGWSGEGGWRVLSAAGEDMPAELLSCRVIGGAAVLRLAWTGRRVALILLPDNLDADMRRRLRMRLSLPVATYPV